MSSFTEAADARILIVDDQSSNVRLLEFTLRRAGYRSIWSTTEPRQVCALHVQNQYDLIILDLQMPYMNGFQVMAALGKVEEAESVAVLVLSADPSQMVPALEGGAADFLSKPFDLSEVLLRVRVLLEKVRAATLAAVLPPPVTAPEDLAVL